MRPAGQADLPFLRDLYATTREHEMAAAGWPKAIGAAFLAAQFALQHQDFVRLDSTVDFWIIEGRAAAPAARTGFTPTSASRGGAPPPSGTLPLGRLYLDRTESTWRIVDIALLPESRGLGLGGLLLTWIKTSARAAGAHGVDLHVQRANGRAEALYRRHGFIATEAAVASHRRLIWRVS